MYRLQAYQKDGLTWASNPLFIEEMTLESLGGKCHTLTHTSPNRAKVAHLVVVAPPLSDITWDVKHFNRREMFELAHQFIEVDFLRDTSQPKRTRIEYKAVE